MRAARSVAVLALGCCWAAVLEELLARPQGTFVYRVQFKRAFGHFVPVPASRDAQEPMGVGSSVSVSYTHLTLPTN